MVVDLSGANLSDSNLSAADFRGANLTGANLTGADLTGADLRTANLAGAGLSRANLSDSNLSAADFRGADLTGADLTGSDLSKAVLMNIKFYDRLKLQNTMIDDAIIDDSKILGETNSLKNVPAVIQNKRELKSRLEKQELPKERVDYLLSISNLPE